MHNITNLILVMLHCSTTKYIMHTIITAGRCGLASITQRFWRDLTYSREWNIASAPLIVSLHGHEIEGGSCLVFNREKGRQCRIQSQ